MIQLSYNKDSKSFSIDRDQLLNDIHDSETRISTAINSSGNDSATPEGFWKDRRKAHRSKFIKDHEPLVKRNTIIGAVAGTGLGVGAGHLMTRDTLNRVANRHPDWDYDRVKKRANLIKTGTMIGTGVAGGVLGGVATNRMTKFDIKTSFDSRIPKYLPKSKPRRR